MTEIITNEAQPIDMQAIETELRPLSSEKLTFRFWECHNGAARMIAEAAICIKLLKERGDDLKNLRPGTRETYVRVANGQIDPLFLWKFIESQGRAHLQNLPIKDQKRLAENPMVPVVQVLPDRKYTTRMVDLSVAPKEVVKLVAGYEGIRSPEEQIGIIAQQKAYTAATTKPDVDEVPSEPLEHRITLRLTASELEALKIHAAKSRLSESEMARRFLIRAGAFKVK